MKVSETEFRDLLGKAKVPVVVDFYADWCAPCRAFAPIFEATFKKMQGEVSFCKVNIDEAEDLIQELSITSVPTIMVFDNSRMQSQHVGTFGSEKELEKFVRKGANLD